MTRNANDRRSRRAMMALVTAAAILASSSTGFAASLTDPDYREGFGKDATGGAGQAVCTVTSSAASGPGTFDSCLQPASNKTIVFAVPTVTLGSTHYIGSNVTIDGCANGMSGVTLDATANAKRGLVVESDSAPVSNVVIRCMNFRSTGTPSSNTTEFDLLGLDSANAISNVLIDRCTFMQASDGALDITGNVSNVTVQRSLFYGNAITMLIKYGTRQNISIHHNVFTRNGERNPQVKGDMRLLDFVNNVVHQNDVPNYPDGGGVSPYGTRIWSCGSGCDSPGNVVANLINNAYVGAGTQVELRTDPGPGTNANVHIGGNYCNPTQCPASPRPTPNAIPVANAVITLETNQIATQVLPYVGAPNRTALDQQRIDAVAAVLPGSGLPATPAAPTTLTVR